MNFILCLRLCENAKNILKKQKSGEVMLNISINLGIKT